MNNNIDNATLKEEKRAEFKEWLEFQKKEFVKNVNIVKQLVLRSIKVQYRNSVIGVFWTILNPLLNMLVMYLVFSSMFAGRGTTQIEQATYPLHLLCGNIVFGMMRNATVQSLPSIVQNRGLLTKNKMSYNVFPLSYALSAVVNFGFSFIALLGVMLVVWIQGQAVFSLNIFLVFIGLPALFLFCYGLSLILSAMYTFFRDISHFYNVFLTLWMYLTPIFYTINMFEGAGPAGAMMKTVIRLNPMYYYVEYFRDVVYRCSAHAYALENMEATEQLSMVAANTQEYLSMVEAATLPGFGETATIYLIGLVTLLVGAIVFMGTKRKFIYNI